MVPQNINGAGVMGRVATARTLVPEISRADRQNPGQFVLQQAIECLKPKLRLAVIFGGNKEDLGSVLYRSQNTRSWKSSIGRLRPPCRASFHSLNGLVQTRM